MKFYFENTKQGFTPGECRNDLFAYALDPDDNGEWLLDTCLCPTTFGDKESVTVAWNSKGEMVGLHVYRFFNGIHSLQSCLTWVAKSCRGQGLGKDLWRVSMAAEEPVRLVEVSVTNTRSCRMLHELSQEFPETTWIIEDMDWARGPAGLMKIGSEKAFCPALTPNDSLQI